MTPMLRHTGPTEDRLAIRELLEAYGDAVCRRDADAWVATWAPDGIWLHRGRTLAGHAELGATWTKAMDAYLFVGFTSYPGAIDVQGDRASARVQTIEWLTPHEGRPFRQHGSYEDRYVKRDCRWYFTERSFTVLHVEPA